MPQFDSAGPPSPPCRITTGGGSAASSGRNSLPRRASPEIRNSTSSSMGTELSSVAGGGDVGHVVGLDRGGVGRGAQDREDLGAHVGLVGRERLHQPPTAAGDLPEGTGQLGGV